LISFTFMPKMPVTKDNGTCKKASRVIICPYGACSWMEPASVTLMELIRMVEQSIRSFWSTMACSRTSCKIKSGYPMYFDPGKFAFTESSSVLTDGGSQSKVIFTCHSICNSSTRWLWSVSFIEMLGRRMSSRPVCLMLWSSILKFVAQVEDARRWSIMSGLSLMCPSWTPEESTW